MPRASSCQPRRKSALDGLSAFDAAADLGRVAAPTLLIWGEWDRWLPREELDQSAATIPGASDRVSGDGSQPELGAPREGRRRPGRLHGPGMAGSPAHDRCLTKQTAAESSRRASPRGHFGVTLELADSDDLL